MAKFLLLGYYGYGNAGDEAVLLALAQGLERGGHEIGVLSASSQTEKLLAPMSVRTFNRLKPLEIVWGLLWCDLLVLGGGSLLQDVTGPFSLHYYLGLIQLAKMLGKPYALCAQGLGPLLRKGSQKRVGRIAKGARHLSVRDLKSRELLVDLGVEPSQIQLVADPVWSLPLAEVATDPPIEEPYLLFALRPWQGREELLFEALPGVMRQTGLPIVYATMHPEFDLPLARRLAAEVGGQVAEAHSFSELLGYFAGAQVVCAMRLHALIFAALLGKRSVAISYDPKVDALVEELGIQALELDEELSALAVAIARAAPPQKKQVSSVVERAKVGLELLRALGRELDGTN